MKQSKRGIVCIAMAGVLVYTSVFGANVTSQAAPKTKKIVLNKKKVTLEVGQTFKVKVKKVKPKKASKKVTFKSSKKKVATVSKKGVIKAKKVGKATITVTSKKNKKVKAKVKVTVTNKTSDTGSGTNATPTPSSGTNGPSGTDATPTPTPTPTSTPTPTPKPTPDTPSGIVAYKIADDASITIDGNEDEAYSIAAALPITSRVAQDNAEDSNTEASVKLLWNKNALYGIAEVKDELVYDDDSRNDYQLDGIEFFLDENNDPNEVTGSWEDNPDGFQYRFTGLTAGMPARTSAVTGGDTAHEDRITADYVMTETGYRVEFKIDFITEKAANDVVGFDIIVQDCDDVGRNAEIYLRKDTNTIQSYYNNVDKFADLTLFDPN